jgi:hypothetical protein
MADPAVKERIATLSRDLKDVKDQVDELQNHKPPFEDATGPATNPPVQSTKNDPPSEKHIPPSQDAAQPATKSPVKSVEDGPPSEPRPAASPDKNSVTLIPERL